MKTSITFNKVINDAGQLALTEGHTVLTSSPRVTPCGLLSFKGDIVKTRKYYTLVGLNTDHVWEIIFGDYDREVVEDERDDIKDNQENGVFHDIAKFKIITTSDKQADIEAKVAGLEKPFTYDEDLFSDLHKDTYGFRPRTHRFYEAPPEEKQEIWNFVCEELKQEIKYQEEAKKKSDEVQTWPSDTVVHRSIGSYEAYVQGLKGGQTWIAGTDIHVIYDDEAKVYRRDPSYEYLPNAEHVYAWSRT